LTRKGKDERSAKIEFSLVGNLDVFLIVIDVINLVDVIEGVGPPRDKAVGRYDPAHGDARRQDGNLELARLLT
jgi:hypothetical protein